MTSAHPIHLDITCPECSYSGPAPMSMGEGPRVVTCPVEHGGCGEQWEVTSAMPEPAPRGAGEYGRLLTLTKGNGTSEIYEEMQSLRTALDEVFAEIKRDECTNPNCGDAACIHTRALLTRLAKHRPTQ